MLFHWRLSVFERWKMEQKLLIVDDEEGILWLLRDYFEISGCAPEETGRQSGDMRRPCGRPGKNPADDRLSPSGLFHVSQYDSV